MQHKVKLTVIDKKLYPELQAKYCSDPASGACPCYNVGDEFIFERYGDADDFWHMGIKTVSYTSASSGENIAGGSSFPHCSEAWDAISRYIYTGLQGGSIMRNWMNDERVMIACCSDGTRPVIFKIQRMDYKVVYIDGVKNREAARKIAQALRTEKAVSDVVYKDKFFEIFMDADVSDNRICGIIENLGGFTVLKID